MYGSNDFYFYFGRKDNNALNRRRTTWHAYKNLKNKINSFSLFVFNKNLNSTIIKFVLDTFAQLLSL